MADLFLDLSGYVCPVPLLKTKDRFRDLVPGDVLRIQTEHPRAVRNILEWAWRLGCPVEADEQKNGIWLITITKDR